MVATVGGIGPYVHQKEFPSEEGNLKTRSPRLGLECSSIRKREAGILTSKLLSNLTTDIPTQESYIPISAS